MFHPVSIDAVVAESGIARMTLYNHFGSKEGLVLAALQHEGSAWRAWFFTRLAEIGGNAEDRLIGVFDILAEWFERADYFGCAFMNAILEARNQDEGGSGLGLAIARDVARSHGGEITLSTSPLGGLRACVRLPI